MATSCLALTLAWPIRSLAAHPDGRDRERYEHVACDDHTHTIVPATSRAQNVDGNQQLEVSVPRTAVLRTGPGGHIVAASTNTGCASRPGDNLYYVLPDGSITAAPTSQLAHRRWKGDFSHPGVFVSQVP